MYLDLQPDEAIDSRVVSRLNPLARLCPLDTSLPDDAMIPGLAIFTKRAGPLATWITGLEVAFFKVTYFKVFRGR